MLFDDLYSAICHTDRSSKDTGIQTEKFVTRTVALQVGRHVSVEVNE